MTIHECLDWHYSTDGDRVLLEMIAAGADANAPAGSLDETPLHVATRRRRASAVKMLLDHGADINAKTAGGKTAYAHAIRRGFQDVVDVLVSRGADTTLNPADQFAVAVVTGRLDDARRILEQHPHVARTGNPEEDRLLADIAGRNEREPVAMLIEAGADLAATGLDGGTPLHQAAWFGQPDNAQLLIDAGAPLERFDDAHQCSPLGWVAHGSRYSGGADVRQDLYVALAHMLLDAGACLHYPNDPNGDQFLARLLQDASPKVAEVLRGARLA